MELYVAVFDFKSLSFEGNGFNEVIYEMVYEVYMLKSQNRDEDEGGIHSSEKKKFSLN